jgi:hypothetical protein
MLMDQHCCYRISEILVAASWVALLCVRTEHVSFSEAELGKWCTQGYLERVDQTSWQCTLSDLR